MFERLFKPRESLKGWWPSLYQSVENPLQRDRLPPTSAIELEYPVASGTPAANGRHTLYLLALGGLAGLIPSVIEQYRDFYHLIPHLLTIAATAAGYYFVSAWSAQRKNLWPWLLSCFGLPLFFVAMVILRDPYLILGLAMLLSVPAADLFATHYFHHKTTAPMPKERSRRLRMLWANRNKLFAPAAPGVEVYLLAWGTIPVVFLILFYLSRRPPTGEFMANFPLVFCGLALLFLIPLVTEALIAFVYTRKVVPPWTIFAAFRAAVVDWFTYNRQGTVAPGLFQSPAGSYAARRRMSLALVVLFATGILQLFSLQRDKLAGLDVHFNLQRSRQLPTLQDRLDDFRWDPQTPLDTPPPAREPPPPDTQDSPWSLLWPPFPGLDFATTAAAAEPTTPLETDMQIFERLQPYQQGRLQRMSPEERRQYFDKARKPRPASKPQRAPEPDHEQTESYQDLIDRMSVRLFGIGLLHVPAGLLRIAYPAFCFLLPPLFFLACCFAASARVVGFWGRELGTGETGRLFSTKTWEDLVSRIQNSGDETEKNSLILGVNAFDDTPVIVPRDLFAEHAHLLGDSGSGKTALGLSSLMAQLIRFGDRSVVVIDLKGDDSALFEGARIEAERKGLRFRWFTNELDRSSYIFNPLTQSHFQRLSLYQRADILATSMGLEYGTDYGRSYYGDANLELIHKALELNPKLTSFAELAPILADKKLRRINSQLWRDASHAVATVNRLAQCEALSPSPKYVSSSALEHAIELSDVFRTPQVLYFSFPSALGTTYSASIARLVLYSLLSASKCVGPQREQVYLFIDEFQRIAAHNLELILQTARSMNIGVILANQSLKDLDTPGSNLISTVRANTRFKQVFAASDLFDQQELVQGAGETIVLSNSWTSYFAGAVSFAGGGRSRAQAETVTPRLRPNDILLATDEPHQSIVCIRRGKDYAQFGGMPFIMTSAFHIDIDDYRNRRKAAWPDRPGETHTARLREAESRNSHEPALLKPEASPKPPVVDPVIRTPEAVLQSPTAKEQAAEATSPPRNRTFAFLDELYESHHPKAAIPSSSRQDLDSPEDHAPDPNSIPRTSQS